MLDAIGKEEPKDFKQLWPAIGTIEKAIRDRIQARKPSAEEQALAAWNDYVEKCKAEGIEGPDPEIQALIAKLNARLSL